MENRERLLPFLSGALYDLVGKVAEKHENCQITKQLLKAHDLTEWYNRHVHNIWEAIPDYVLDSVLDSINKLINDEARMLSFRFNTFEISYLPKGKEAKYSADGVWSRENRQTAKPARLFQKVLNQEFKCKEFEDFNNWLKAEMTNCGTFELVEGEAIRDAYLEDNYYDNTGTIGNSCMRYSCCQDYMDIYVDNAKLLVCKKDGKILGRAIVWELEEGTFMDRIYVCMDHLETAFIDYAESHKWYHRLNNSLLSDGEMQEWLTPESNYKNSERLNLTVHLKNHYELMPYIDSFRYYDPDKNIITTDCNIDGYCCSCTNGEYDDGRQRYECENCGHVSYGYDDEIPDDIVWSEHDECYYCEDCAQWSSGLDEYYGPHTTMVVVYSNLDDYYTYPEYYIHDHSDDFIAIDDKWWDINSPDINYDKQSDTWSVRQN